ncbi:hypothetical protein ASPBRDRAFT_515675 [Aspergillus brasiliensis CBS 101740]|uniref:Uncharacterized protein n=1 Tax=Aspergillus brasiliensis (strain CBS 101740 / IMI 381727 / IBT 21946) TaxID=767769 RepID=A0A1L9UQ82_ASPBC|nr:hypothetical protein ASPBRDRAFT_515675 [Aspergillus brasiliensis CBS 101740]
MISNKLGDDHSIGWLAQQDLISPFASSRWRKSFFEIHHDHEANIIYGGFCGMCTRCIRRGHWSLNSATVHRPVQVPYSVFSHTLAFAPVSLDEDCLDRLLLWGSIGSWKLRMYGLKPFPAGLNRGRRILITNNRATWSGKPRSCLTLRPCLGGEVSIPYATVPLDSSFPPTCTGELNEHLQI